MDINILPENIVSNTFITLQMHGVVALPVGHRVEVRIFNSPKKANIFGLGKSKPQFEFPLIFDLETGICYGDLSHFYNLDQVYSASQLFEAQITPFEHLAVYKAFEGLVNNCNILSAKLDGIKTQTTLVIKVTQEIIE